MQIFRVRHVWAERGGRQGEQGHRHLSQRGGGQGTKQGLLMAVTGCFQSHCLVILTIGICRPTWLLWLSCLVWGHKTAAAALGHSSTNERLMKRHGRSVGQLTHRTYGKKVICSDRLPRTNSTDLRQELNCLLRLQF